jgi:excisionase family DNA binding protein
MSAHDAAILPPSENDRFRFEAIVAGLKSSYQHAQLKLPSGVELPLPPEMAEVLYGVAVAMARGQAVIVAPKETTLTTSKAADFLGISRPTLIKLLVAGDIPFTTVGNHRRILLDDVISYRDAQRERASRGLDELVALSEDLGLYEDEAIRPISDT